MSDLSARVSRLESVISSQDESARELNRNVKELSVDLVQLSSNIAMQTKMLSLFVERYDRESETLGELVRSNSKRLESLESLYISLSHRMQGWGDVAKAFKWLASIGGVGFFVWLYNLYKSKGG